MKKKMPRALVISILFMTALSIAIVASIALCWSNKDTLTKNISYWLNKPVIDERRHHIFCDTLKPGMDRNTVLITLEQFGKFDFGEAHWGKDWENGYSELFGQFTDEQIAGRNTLILSFQDGKYLGTNVITFLDDTEDVCK